MYKNVVVHVVELSAIAFSKPDVAWYSTWPLLSSVVSLLWVYLSENKRKKKRLKPLQKKRKRNQRKRVILVISLLFFLWNNPRGLHFRALVLLVETVTTWAQFTRFLSDLPLWSSLALAVGLPRHRTPGFTSDYVDAHHAVTMLFILTHKPTLTKGREGHSWVELASCARPLCPTHQCENQ